MLETIFLIYDIITFTQAIIAEVNEDTGHIKKKLNQFNCINLIVITTKTSNYYCIGLAIQKWTLLIIIKMFTENTKKWKCF